MDRAAPHPPHSPLPWQQQPAKGKRSGNIRKRQAGGHRYLGTQFELMRSIRSAYWGLKGGRRWDGELGGGGWGSNRWALSWRLDASFLSTEHCSILVIVDTTRQSCVFFPICSFLLPSLTSPTSLESLEDGQLGICSRRYGKRQNIWQKQAPCHMLSEY